VTDLFGLELDDDWDDGWKEFAELAGRALEGDHARRVVTDRLELVLYKWRDRYVRGTRMRGVQVLRTVNSEHLEVVFILGVRALVTDLGWTHDSSEPEFGRDVFKKGDRVARLWRQSEPASLVFDVSGPSVTPPPSHHPVLNKIAKVAGEAGAVRIEAFEREALLDMDTQDRFFPPVATLVLAGPYTANIIVSRLEAWRFTFDGSEWSSTNNGWTVSVRLQSDRISVRLTGVPQTT